MRSESADGSRAARWEERTTTRVVDSSREQILKRSRRIVDAAYELLATEGLEGVTIRSVLQKTGLSRRAFYERFADKDDLMLAVFEETIRLATRYYREQVESLADPMEGLKLIITSVALARSNSSKGEPQSSRRGVAMSREHLRLAQSRPADLQAALSPLIELIAEQLKAGMSVGAVRKADPQRMAMLVYNLIATTVHTELLSHEGDEPNPARREQLAADIWEFCRRAIAV